MTMYISEKKLLCEEKNNIMCTDAWTQLVGLTEKLDKGLI